MSTTSTYMGFPISSIGTDSGLNWETNLNAALMVIDQHNHSPGSGQQIQPNGLNINSDLTFNSNNAVAIRATRFTSQVSAIPNSGADVGQIYVAGNDLWYNDVSGGNQVQLTLNGTVNATSSGISSGTATAAFSAGTLVVKSSSSSYGNVALQSVVLANSGNLVNQLTLQAPTLSSSYSLTLPAVPGATAFMTLDSSGNMAGSIPIAGSLTASNISASAAILGSQLSGSAAILGSQLSATAGITPSQNTSSGYTDDNANSGSFASSSTSAVTVMTSVALASVSTTRPVFITFQGAGNTTSSGLITLTSGGINVGALNARFFLYRKNGLTISLVGQATLVGTTPGVYYFPASSLNFVDFFPAGSQYQLNVMVSNASYAILLDDVNMQVYQV